MVVLSRFTSATGPKPHNHCFINRLIFYFSLGYEAFIPNAFPAMSVCVCSVFSRTHFLQAACFISSLCIECHRQPFSYRKQYKHIYIIRAFVTAASTQHRRRRSRAQSATAYYRCPQRRTPGPTSLAYCETQIKRSNHILSQKKYIKVRLGQLITINYFADKRGNDEHRVS